MNIEIEKLIRLLNEYRNRNRDAYEVIRNESSRNRWLRADETFLTVIEVLAEQGYDIFEIVQKYND